MELEQLNAVQRKARVLLVCLDVKQKVVLNFVRTRQHFALGNETPNRRVHHAERYDLPISYRQLKTDNVTRLVVTLNACCERRVPFAGGLQLDESHDKIRRI